MRPGAEEPNSYWLSRLLATTMSWKYQERAVAYLRWSLEVWVDWLRPRDASLCKMWGGDQEFGEPVPMRLRLDHHPGIYKLQQL